MEVTQVPGVPPTPEPSYVPSLPPVPPVTPPPPSPPKPKRKRIVLGLILLLLLVGLITAFAVVAYQGMELPHVSKELSFQLQRTYAKLPFVPKAPRHILLQSLDSSLEIKTFTLDASISMAKFDLALYGDAEVKEDTANFDLHLTAKSSDPTFPLTLETDLISLDKIFYFRVGTLVSPTISTFMDFSPAIGKWWRYDFTPLETKAREELEKEQEAAAKTVTQQAQRKAIEIFSKPEIVKAVTRENDERIGDEASYHLRIVPTKETYLKLVEALQEKPLTDVERTNLEKSFEGIEKLELDLWIGKNTLVARKIKFFFKIKPSLEGIGTSPYTTSLNLLGMGTFEGVFVLEIPKINAPVSITAPEGARNIEELYEIIGIAPLYERSRDAHRLSDLESLRTAIELAILEGVKLPTLKAPSSSTAGGNWVKMDLSGYILNLPTDPKNGKAFTDCKGNKVTGEYQFMSDGTYYVLRTRLEEESNCKYYTDDKNANNWYEVGTAPGLSKFFGL